jgi:HD-GYP domain-containing protein (c-di-GMP phosphodiesterase class II)
MKFRVRFKVSIISAILLIIFSLMVASITSVWVISSHTAKSNAEHIFGNAFRSAEEQLNHFVDELGILASLGTTQASMSEVSGSGLKALPLSFMITALDKSPWLYSLYYGFENGDFLQVITANNDRRVLEPHKAPKASHWIVRAITNDEAGEKTSTPGAVAQNRVQIWTFLNRDREIIETRSEANPQYDPRARPWYKNSIGASEPKLSAPYIFNSLKQPGLTVSKRLENRGAVFGVDVTLTRLSTITSNIEISEHGGLILIDDGDRVLSMSDTLGKATPLASVPSLDILAAKAVQKLQRDGQVEGIQSLTLNGVKYLAQYTNWEKAGHQFGIFAVAPLDDFIGLFHAMQEQILLLTLASLIIFVPGALIFSSRMSSQITSLAAEARRVQGMDFSETRILPSRIVEFFDLSQSFSLMKADIASRTKALETSEDKLGRLVTLGVAMSGEKDSDKLMEMILLGAKELSNADGGTLYILNDDQKLDFQMLHNDTLGLAFGGLSGEEIDFSSVPLFDDDGAPNRRNVVSFCVHEGETINISDAYDHSEFDFSGTKIFDQDHGYHSKSFLTVPLKPRGGEIIGVLQLINARGADSDAPTPFSAEIQSFVEALSAQAATALYNRNLLQAQQDLMDGMIHVIGGAIDAKSPYTGRHCERVPKLAMMLAEEASQSDIGVFSEFRFETEEEWREFHIGAWLHDCGKVITPEYVVDKATKLETIYNRIHEIRTRFEILLRDADIERLNKVLSGADADDAQKVYDARKSELVEDFAFVANSNIGAEFMVKEDIERLTGIAENTWLRHFDDRLGLAHDELGRYAEEAVSLPVAEKLLDDKPHHLLEREEGIHQMYEEFRFKVNIPEHLHNFGELTNLSIERGTLSEEERFIVNQHIMQTIAMLERLPFPKHLQRVPEYAGTHHEALNGTGYPRQLKKDDLSVPARIMAVADIFEALTASDRPYKKPKTLSESVRILSFFKKDGHIDSDVFDLFLSSGIYQRYADDFLNPSQIDEVDISAYVDA